MSKSCCEAANKIRGRRHQAPENQRSALNPAYGVQQPKNDKSGPSFRSLAPERREVTASHIDVQVANRLHCPNFVLPCLLTV